MERGAGESQLDSCYALLRHQIVTCSILPGARLTERELIERLGFGRTPVREALLRLSHDRLVETMPRSGYRVRPITRKSIADFYAIWRAVAPLTARLSVPRLSSSQRTRLVNLAAERDALKDEDDSQLASIAAQFFPILLEAADNEQLTYIHRLLGAEMERIFTLFFATAAGREWIGSGSDIAAFSQMTNGDLAARRIEARVIASEEVVLAHLDPMLGDEEPQWVDASFGLSAAPT